MNLNVHIKAGIVAAAVCFAVAATVDQGIRATPEYRHAMSEYRAGHPVCEWCGTTKQLEVHHEAPLWLDPSKASDTNRFVVLCRIDHQRLGHCGKWGSVAVTNLKVIVSQRIIVVREK